MKKALGFNLTGWICMHSHMCGWLDWNWNNFISYFNQLYHRNI